MGLFKLPKARRNYKDTVFVDLFGKCPEAKANFLSLYNAMHGTNLTLAETDIKPMMLEKTIYQKRYNDVSMLVNGQLIVLVEQQSTINENMPLRFLEYIARIYEDYVPQEDRYKIKTVQLPMPEFYVFYNGTDNYPAEKVLKLSDAFVDAQKNYKKNENSLLELTVTVYNINKQQNVPFVQNCASLNGYSTLIEYDREAIKASIKDHLGYAIERCIEEGILVDYLTRNTKEVRNMLIAEYDYKTDIKVKQQEAFEKGIDIQKAEDEKLLAEKDDELARQAAENKRLLEEIAKLKANL